MEEEFTFTDNQATLADDEASPEEEETVIEGSDTLIGGSDTLIEESDTLIEESDTLIEEGDTLIEESDTLIEESDTLPEDGFTLGTVKWFSRMKGWGFIEPDGGDRDVFVHYESIVGEGFRNLEKGERVQFRVEDSPKGPKAAQVSSLDTAF